MHKNEESFFKIMIILLFGRYGFARTFEITDKWSPLEIRSPDISLHIQNILWKFYMKTFVFLKKWFDLTVPPRFFSSLCQEMGNVRGTNIFNFLHWVGLNMHTRQFLLIYEYTWYYHNQHINYYIPHSFFYKILSFVWLTFFHAINILMSPKSRFQQCLYYCWYNW